MPDKITVEIQTMKTSAGADYFVSITCGDRNLTPYMFKDLYKAAYEVDHFLWLFGQRPEKPDMMAYNETTHPNTYPKKIHQA